MIRICSFLLALCWFTQAQATDVPLPNHDPRRDIIFMVLGPCGNPCVIKNNDGGWLVMFDWVKKAVHEGGVSHLVIDGDCYSSCAILADDLLDKTCITPNAAFHFHKVKGNTPPHSAFVNDWVQKRGGYSAKKFRTMKFEDAKQHWKVCDP